VSINRYPVSLARLINQILWLILHASAPQRDAHKEGSTAK
jgi:hypothetical protein